MRTRWRKQEAYLANIFDSQSSAFYTSGHMLDDGMIDPRDARKTLGFLLETVWETRHRTRAPEQFRHCADVDVSMRSSETCDMQHAAHARDDTLETIHGSITQHRTPDTGTQGSVLTIWFNRPAAKNSLSAEMIDELHAVLDACGDRPLAAHADPARQGRHLLRRRRHQGLPSGAQGGEPGRG